MATTTFKYTLQSTISGALNPAICNLTFTDAGMDADSRKLYATRGLMWLAVAMNWYSEAGITLVSAEWADRPGDGYLIQPLDAAQWTADRADFSTPTWIPESYAGNFGPSSGGSNGRGDSVCVRFITTLASRAGKGRVFVPFTTPSAIDTATGLISATRRGYVDEAWDEIINGEGTDNLAVAVPQAVFSPTDTVTSLVTNAITNQIPSRLRSRTK